MKKRLLTAFLAVAMLVSSVPSAMAAKKPVADDSSASSASTNNVYAWGDFENPAAIDMIKLPSDRADLKYIERGGADGTKYSLKIDSLSSSQAYSMNFPFPVVPGETYEFSFYYKGDKNNVFSNLYPIFIPTGGGWVYLPTISLSGVNDWTLYKQTWTCPEKTDNGKALTNGVGGYIQFRGGRMDMERRIAYSMDEIKLIPQGNVADVDYTWANSGYNPVEVSLPNTTAEAVNSTEVNFADVTGHWAEAIIEDLAKYGYVNGIGNGLYSPDSTLTRAQFIKMATNFYDMEAPVYDGRFKDVAGDEWFAAPLMIADDLGLIDVAMKLGGVIKPNAPITREEAASIAARVAKERGAKADSSNATTFTDSASVSEWAKASVKDAASYGLIKGYDTGEYKPAAGLTRAEAAQILFRIVETKSKMHIYVDAQNGDDVKGDGSAANPYGSIDKARMVAREYAPTMETDLKILLRGEFKLRETMKLGPEDSGANGYSIIYSAWGTEEPVITMADEFSGFELHDSEKNIWKTYVGNAYSRQAFFNDVRGIRARTNERLTNEECIGKEYFLVDDEWLLDIRYPSELEFTTCILWTQQTYRIDSVEKLDNGRIKINPNIYFPENNYYHDFNTTATSASAFPMWLENAYEFLDDKGEWYLNTHDGYLYYIPRTGEDMSNMTVKLPTGEYLIKAEGYGKSDPVANITFENIIFEGTTNLQVEREGGWSDQQNVSFKLDDERTDFTSYNQPWKSTNPQAAVDFMYCYNIKFLKNTFRQLGTIAVTFREGSRYVDFIGNEIYDCAGGGINIDTIKWAADTRPEDTYSEYIRVNNNYIHHVALEWASAAAISAVWPRHSQFNHNEIHTIPYSAFHIGWGWQNYAATGTPLYDMEINYNYCHDIFLGRNFDGGAIYTLGASSLECDKTNTALNNRMFGNYVSNSWNGEIYPDEGSTSWHIKGNVIDASRVKYIESHLHEHMPTGTEMKPWAMHMHAGSIMWITTENNYATVDYAYAQGWMNARESVIDPIKRVEPGDWENWPQEAKDIMANAGVESEYRHLFDGIDGAKSLICDDRRQSLPLETPIFSGIHIVGGLDNSYEYPLENFELDVHTKDPDAITLTEDGYWIAHKKGIVEADVVTRINGYTQIMHVKLLCGNDVEKVALNTEAISVVVDAFGEYTATAFYTFGNTEDVTLQADIDLKADDPIVTVERTVNGSKDVIRVTPTGEVGETTIRGTITYQGITADVEIPVSVITYGNNEALTLPYTTLNMGAGWRDAPKKVGSDGYKVSGSPNPGHRIENQLIAFDMMCEPGSDWPTIGFCDSDRMGNYNKNDLYMIGFKEDLIELQKFNGGVRTMFFGPDEFNPISGPGIPNTGDKKIFEYGKRYSIVIGALDVDGGTRIILNINGENIIDYVDTTHNAIPAAGNIVVYNPNSSTYQGLYEEGGFTFWPYTGIVNEKEEEK